MSYIKIVYIIYIGLPSHPQYDIVNKQCTGFGGMVSFRLKGNSDTALKFIKSVKVGNLVM